MLRKVTDHVVIDPRTESIRGWLVTIVRHKLLDYHARPRHLWQGSGDSQVHALIENQAARENGDQSEWEREYQRSLFAWAAEKVKPQVQPATWQAFWQTAVEGRAGQEVAKNLGLSLAAVYIAKSRVIVRLRDAIRAMEENENGKLSR